MLNSSPLSTTHCANVPKTPKERQDRDERRREEDARREREESRNAQRMALFGSLATAFARVVIDLVKSKVAAPTPTAMPDLRPVLDTMTSMIEQHQRASTTLLEATIDRAKTIAGLGQPEKPGILDRLANVTEAIAARLAGEAPPAPTAMPVASGGAWLQSQMGNLRALDAK